MEDLRCLIGNHDFRPHNIEGGGGTNLECRRRGKVDDSFDPQGQRRHLDPRGLIPRTRHLPGGRFSQRGIPFESSMQNRRSP